MKFSVMGSANMMDSRKKCGVGSHVIQLCMVAAPRVQHSSALQSPPRPAHISNCPHWPAADAAAAALLSLDSPAGQGVLPHSLRLPLRHASAADNVFVSNIHPPLETQPRWSKVCARNASASPYGHLPGWSLRGCIIKSGDDCRQELLALQLIRELADIWAGARVSTQGSGQRLCMEEEARQMWCVAEEGVCMAVHV
jgi:hypothetical protein